MHRDSKSFFEKMFYRYEYLGDVEKDGNVYKKYKKVKRFENIDLVFHILKFTLILIGVIALAHFLGSIFTPKR